MSARAPDGSADRLLVLDWGVGGFGVVAALRARAPGLALTYFSDSGFTPYGRVPPATLARRLGAVLRHFHARGARHAVLACNAASTVVARLELDALGAERLRITDVVGPGVDLVRSVGLSRVGLLGGARTVRSGVHRRRLGALGIVVSARIAQPLSAHVERGDLDSPALDAVVSRIVAPLRGEAAVLLACTHYPAIAVVLRRHLPGVRLLDPAAHVARLVCPKRAIALPDARTARTPAVPLRVFTTGDPSATREGALRAFGVDTGLVGRMPLDLA